MNIFVGNLNPDTVAEGLRTLFSEFGVVLSSKVIIDNATGMSRGFGFVEMADYNASQDAIDNLDYSFFEGNIISVKEAKQNGTPTRGGGGGGNRSFGGGNRSFGSGQGGGTNSGTGRPFKPRIPRPGSGSGNYNSSGSVGGYNRDRDSNNSNIDRDFNKL